MISVNTIRRAEAGTGEVRMMGANARAVQKSLEDAGVEFIPENGGGAGVRMREPG